MRADLARTIPTDRNHYTQGIEPARSRRRGCKIWYSSPSRQGGIIELVTHICACDVRDDLYNFKHTSL